MPLLYKKKGKGNTFWGVWKIDEDSDQLLTSLKDHSFLQQPLTSPKRIIEQATVRVLLKSLLGKEMLIEYADSGRPFLKNSLLNISISHTKGYAAIIISAYPCIGIDIEYISDKVERIRSKFISDQEFIDSDSSLIHLLLHWSAKETIYKAIDRKRISLKEDFHVSKFIPIKSGYFDLTTRFRGSNESYLIHYFVENDYVLTLTY